MRNLFSSHGRTDVRSVQVYANWNNCWVFLTPKSQCICVFVLSAPSHCPASAGKSKTIEDGDKCPVQSIFCSESLYMQYLALGSLSFSVEDKMQTLLSPRMSDKLMSYYKLSIE